MIQPTRRRVLAAPTDAARPRFTFDSLESRTLLSATGDIFVHPNLTLSPSSATAASAGYSPQQIAKAYGFDQISFSNGTIKGDGTGQTIAIVDAYDNPNIVSDLHTFDTAFGLDDPPSLTKVSQTGGSTGSIKMDAGWASEIAMDVEWAHAMAPGANILLVEARSSSLTDLLSAVDYARNASGVSAISLSWGTDEFASQTIYDKYFATPTGHSGVTFVAASGDDGSRWGPEWPATSKNVVSVGGTTLSLDSSGNYLAETGWRHSTGGLSRYESEPSYQSSVQTTGVRSGPDVSYNADPNTGFAVYSSITLDGSSGWTSIGGTSAGAPQWAALVAIANQGRAASGLTALDGTGTLTGLYNLYSSATTYSADFRDISSGRSGFNSAAHPGYDTVTGLGSPMANQIVHNLVGVVGSQPTNLVYHAPRTIRTARAAAVRVTTNAPLPAASVAAVKNTVSHVSVSENLLADSAQAVVKISSGTNLSSVVSSAAPTMSLLFGTLRDSNRLLIGGAGVDTGTMSATPVAGAVAVASAEVLAITQPLQEVAEPVVNALGGRMVHITQFGSPLRLLTDSVALFADESAAISAQLAGRHSRVAWMVTGTVIAADVVLYLYVYRRSARRRRWAVVS